MNLPEIRGEYRLNYNLAHLTWFKVGGEADILFKPEDTDDLISFLQQNNGLLPVTVIGAGSNVIIRDNGIEGVVVKLGRNFTNIEINDNIEVGAACLNFNLSKFCLSHQIKDFEFLSTIPGTAGGGIAMNAGAYGFEFKDIVIAVEAIDFHGNKHIIPNKDIGFSYRKNNLQKNLIFTKIIFKKVLSDGNLSAILIKKMQEARAQTQPIAEKTGGSTFANPVSFKAWELIDKAGLRGERLGGASMSKLHCNFMINDGSARASDLENLGELVRQEVKKNSGIELEWEIKRIGRK